jgi:uncharacterized protein
LTQLQNRNVLLNLLARQRTVLRLLVTALAFASVASFAFDVPQFTPNVVDTDGVLSVENVSRLNGTIRKLRAESHIFAAVLIVPTVQPQSIEQAAEETFRKWALGQKGVDNGLLILVAVNDRKVRIEVGYGLEGSIPDVNASRIIRQILAPRFKQQDYVGGIDEALMICNDLVLHGDSIRLKSESEFSLDPRYWIAGAIWALLIVVAPIAMRAAAVARASRYKPSLQPSDEERAWGRIAFLNGLSLFLTIFLLINPGIFFVSMAVSKRVLFTPFFVGFSYLFLGMANSGYLAMFKPRWREKFLSSTHDSQGAWSGVPQAFQSSIGRSSSSSGSSSSRSSGSSSSSSSSSGGGGSGGGGASGSW